MRFWRAGIAAWYIASFAPSQSQAAVPTMDDKLCGLACRRTFRTLKFADAPEGAYFARQECSSLLYQQSLYLCWDIHCTREVWLAEATGMNQTCQATSNEYFPLHDIVNGFADEDIARLARFNATSPNRLFRLDVPVLPTQPYYDLWVRTLDAHDYVFYYHHHYGWVMGVFWTLVVAVGIGNRALMKFEAWSARFVASHNRGFVWLKRHILMPATFGWRCVQDFGGWGTLPPRVQTLTITSFVLMNVFCTVHGYRIFDGYIYYPSTGMQILRHVSDRTGIISFANFPLIWLFGMRNNLVIWLTGWEFKTYNNFHRWVARVATVQAIIHSIGYTALILRKGGWDYFWWMCKLTYWWTGELATVFMSFLVVLSAFWFRRRQYEFFLVTHIALSILILWTMLSHVSIFRGVYDALGWVPVMIWLCDRLLRGARIVAFNPRFWNANALVTYNEEAHMIRVVISASSSLYRIEPGTFYYLMVLNKWRFWESHPFTVASVSGNNRYEEEYPGASLPLLEHEHSSAEIRRESEKTGREMTFLIRPYDSFTLRLKEYAEAKWPEPAAICVAIDGPYGETLPLDRFSKVLFVVGGSGIAVPVSYLKKLTESPTRPRLIHIHWTVRQPALAVDVLNRELKSALNNEHVKVNVYVTGANYGTSAIEALHRLAEWKSKRMNVDEVIEDIIDTGEKGSLAVVASGPGMMADSCRRAVVARMVDALPYIEYFEESFQW